MTCKHEPLRELPGGVPFRWMTLIRSGIQVDIDICKHCMVAYCRYIGPITQDFKESIQEAAVGDKPCAVCNEEDRSVLRICQDRVVRCQACYDVWSDKG